MKGEVKGNAFSGEFHSGKEILISLKGEDYTWRGFGGKCDAIYRNRIPTVCSTLLLYKRSLSWDCMISCHLETYSDSSCFFILSCSVFSVAISGEKLKHGGTVIFSVYIIE
ncbi:hypothetical protein TNIN_294731 [Trichonephila inaurata madagascariensis]|uniref:Uncharacterized protein n=1 Tax=Trichonephila inaurata madagascariensis TaxID=2747483 RepID=A0A8X6MBC7_9ARAC|nr:hypothetical protein TNIN_294731 [Trichonephila inaurata madagascariensis]